MKLEVREVRPVDPPKEYVLTLDQNELDIITLAVGKVGGYDGENGWRSIVNSLYGGLRHQCSIKDSALVLDFSGNVNDKPGVKPK